MYRRQHSRGKEDLIAIKKQQTKGEIRFLQAITLRNTLENHIITINSIENKAVPKTLPDNPSLRPLADKVPIGLHSQAR